MNHVLLHQTVVGEETMKQFEKIGVYPDVLVGCIGGGSNFAGFVMPFVRDKLVNGKETRIIAVEPTACPSLTQGLYTYDFGDTAMTTPLIKMYTLGHSFIPAPIHAGGLRYHGMAPIVCALYDQGIIEAIAVPQLAVFQAAVDFARAEGFVAGPEPAHAIRVVIDEALKAREAGEKKVIAFNYSGHGHFDLEAYDKFLSNKLEDYAYPREKVEAALRELPKVAA